MNLSVEFLTQQEPHLEPEIAWPMCLVIFIILMGAAHLYHKFKNEDEK